MNKPRFGGAFSTMKRGGGARFDGRKYDEFTEEVIVWQHETKSII